jgi:hypothetical protein
MKRCTILRWANKYFFFTAVIFIALVLKNLFEHSLENSHKQLNALSHPILPLTQETTCIHFQFASILKAVEWIRVLQNNDLENSSPIYSNEFRRFIKISYLDRNFMPVYYFGSSYLAILKKDKQGSRLLMERWKLNDPTNWKPFYHLGHLLYSDFDDYKEAASNILRASQMEGAPFWLSSLGIRLLAEEGLEETSLALSVELYETLSDPLAKDRLARRIRSLNYMRQKRERERALSEYTKRKGHSPSRIEELTPFLSTRELASSPVLVIHKKETLLLLNETFPFLYNRENQALGLKDKVLEKELSLTGIHRIKQR